jgi:hypothetical protein
MSLFSLDNDSLNIIFELSTPYLSMLVLVNKQLHVLCSQHAIHHKLERTINYNLMILEKHLNILRWIRGDDYEWDTTVETITNFNLKSTKKNNCVWGFVTNNVNKLRDDYYFFNGKYGKTNYYEQSSFDSGQIYRLVHRLGINMCVMDNKKCINAIDKSNLEIVI